jgi:hypothetical protein
MKEGVTLKFQEFKEDEEYFGYALPVVWMRATNLPRILREYVILWALGTLFGVTQDVDMVTTRANNFERFAVAVIEPKAIPTKLYVIIGNRYFQLTFEVEPFLPNIGLGNIWNPQNNGSEDHGNGVPKDTEMKEAQISGDTILPGASAGSATRTNLTGKEDKASEAQMDYDWANDDLLGEEHELNEATRSFLGIKKGDPINVKNVATIATPGSGVLSAPAHIQQSQPQSSKPANFLSSAALAPQLSTEGGSAREECLGRVQQPLLSASAAACDMQILKSCQQYSDILIGIIQRSQSKRLV